MGSVSRADRDSIISAVMRRFKRQEAIMIARIDIPDKKKKKDNKRKSRRP